MTTARMLIDGAWVDAGDGDRFDTVDPATGEVLATIPAAGPPTSTRAVAAARRAFDDGTWGMARSPSATGRPALRDGRAGARATRDELAELEVRDCGKPIADAVWDVDEVGVHVRVLRRLGHQDHRRHPAGRARGA